LAENQNDFFRFPRTPHLVWLLDKPARGDRVLSKVEAQRFLSAEIVVEEKVDGANLGISASKDGSLRVQNRGAYLSQPSHPQFAPLWPWLAPRRSALLNALGSDLVLFGEWCFAVHSAHYDRLPDWFLAFDLYDRSVGKFWSAVRRNRLMQLLGIAVVPEVARGSFQLDSVRRLLTSSQSALGSEPVEGLYLRREEEEWLQDRAKIVRPEFVQNIGEHWSSRTIEKNRLLTHTNVHSPNRPKGSKLS
jgi:ATP-dependent RNA circularization protein (DNA/RNA ligase family)